MNQLSERELMALDEALDDEHKAWATYDQVIRDFEPVRPFINIKDIGVQAYLCADRFVQSLRTGDCPPIDSSASISLECPHTSNHFRPTNGACKARCRKEMRFIWPGLLLNLGTVWAPDGHHRCSLDGECGVTI